MAEKDTKPAAKKVPGLRVTAKQAGFRRAGIAWSATPTEVAVSDFSKEQIATLKAEPMLVVEEVEVAEGAEV